MSFVGLKELLGVMLVANWLATALYAVELIQAWHFFGRYPDDRWWHKALVTLALLSDTAGTASTYYEHYQCFITHWGDQFYVFLQRWPTAVYIVTTGASTATYQSFLLRRYWGLSNNWIITLVIASAVLATVSMSIWAGAIVFIYRDASQHQRLVKPTTISLIMTASLDLVLAGLLAWQLSRARANTEYRHSKRFYRRLIVRALEVGVFTAALAGVCALAVVKNIRQPFTFTVGFVIPRIYTITMLWCLNSRTQTERTPRGWYERDTHNMLVTVDGDACESASRTRRNASSFSSPPTADDDPFSVDYPPSIALRRLSISVRADVKAEPISENHTIARSSSRTRSKSEPPPVSLT